MEEKVKKMGLEELAPGEDLRAQRGDGGSRWRSRSLLQEEEKNVGKKNTFPLFFLLLLSSLPFHMATAPASRAAPPRGPQKGVAWVDTVIVAALLVAAALVLYFF